MTVILILACLGVTVGPGWSDPVMVTDSANTERTTQYIHMDQTGNFHLVWAGFNDDDRIGYKIFDINGTALYPETMLSRNVHSLYLTTIEMSDSLYAFFREVSPVYTAARSMQDGSEVLPATYQFTSSTWIPEIRSSPDSLGRLHVLYNGGVEGMDLFYEVWSPSPDSGFAVDYGWQVPGVVETGSILVDADRVHIVTRESITENYAYLQYDLEGNTTVPLTQFTYDYFWLWRFPDLLLDPAGNLMVVAYTAPPGSTESNIFMWKLDCISGETLIDELPLVATDPPVVDTSNDFAVSRIADTNEYHLCWEGQYAENKIFHMIFDSEGNTVYDWQLAYDYSEEEPEDVIGINGVSDESGNYYLIFTQGDTIPVLGSYPTFGWLDYSSLGIEEIESAAPADEGFLVSQNPVTESLTVIFPESIDTDLSVFDLAGRKVAEIPVSEGSAMWNGCNHSGEPLPPGVYTISCSSGYSRQVTLIRR